MGDANKVVVKVPPVNVPSINVGGRGNVVGNGNIQSHPTFRLGGGNNGGLPVNFSNVVGNTTNTNSGNRTTNINSGNTTNIGSGNANTTTNSGNTTITNSGNTTNSGNATIIRR